MMKIYLTKNKYKRFLVLGLLGASLMGGQVYAQDEPQSALSSLFGSKQKFLPVHQAFKVNARQEGEFLVVDVDVTPAHYIYQDKLLASLPEGLTAEAWQFSQVPTTVDDPQFGKVAVFEKSFTAKAKLKQTDNAENTNAAVRWQGCAVAGLCYPPERTAFRLNLEHLSKVNAPTAEQNKTTTSPTFENKTGDEIKPDAITAKERLAISKTHHAQQAGVALDKDVQDKPNKSTPSNPSETPKNATQANDDIDGQHTPKMATDKDIKSVNVQTDKQAVAPQVDDNPVQVEPLNHIPTATLSHALDNAVSDPFGLGERPVLAVLLLFLTGLGLAFTACVYPMIPIVANIVARSKTKSAVRGFFLTLAYGLGVATSYGLLGAIIAWFGRSLGIIGWLQNPVVLMGFALIFVVLGLQMMGVIHLSLPHAIKNRLSQASSSADGRLGSLSGSFLVGFLSALVVSPCVSAPLGGALLTVSVLGNVALGFVALFALGFGLSVPLLFVGAMQGKFMPKAGQWLDRVKEFAGFMLFAVAILLMNRIFLSPMMLVVWAFWFLALALWAWRLKVLLCQVLGVATLIWAILLFIGVAIGANDPWRPLQSLVSPTSALTTTSAQTPAPADIKITTLSALDEVLAKKPNVLVDVTADWCIECRIMEKNLFKNRPQTLSNWQVVKLDVTETTEHSREILARYGLFGPPALLYYQEGKLVNKQLGEVARSDFEQALTKVY